MVTVIPKSRTIQNNTANDAVPVESNFSDLFANCATLATAVTALESSGVVSTFFRGFNACSAPVYTSSTVISLATVACRNDANDGFMANVNQSVDLNAIGVNGCAQSSNLSGTISVQSGFNTVTGAGTSFTTVYQIGDVIRTAGNQLGKITAIPSNTALTVETNWASTENAVAYRRGGKAANTWYHLYAIGNPSTAGLLLTTRSQANGDTVVDLPTGYSKKRQLAFSIKTDASGNFPLFIVGAGWPIRPEILLRGAAVASVATVSATSWVAVAAGCPITSRLARVKFEINAVTGTFNQASWRETGSAFSRGIGVPANITGVVDGYPENVVLDASGTFEAQVSVSPTTLNVLQTGYTITQVA
jgi:hypothetical protein